MPLRELFGFKKRNPPAPVVPQQPTYQAPADPMRALAIAERVRNARQQAADQHLELAGALAARSQLVLDAMELDDYTTAQGRLDALENDLGQEAQQRDALRQTYLADKQALEQGRLSRVPAVPSPLHAALHARIGRARGRLPAAPQTLADYNDATSKLRALKKVVRNYLDAAAQTLADDQETYQQQRTALESGDLARVPDASPKAELAQLHAAVVAARQALPGPPKTQAEADLALPALADLRLKVRTYLEAESPLTKAARRQHADLLRQIRSNRDKLADTTDDLRPQAAALQKDCDELPDKLDRLADADALITRMKELESRLAEYRQLYQQAFQRVRAEFQRSIKEVRKLGWGDLPQWAPEGAETEYKAIIELRSRMPRGWNIESSPSDMEILVRLHEELKPLLVAYRDRAEALLPQRTAELKAAEEALFTGALKEMPAQAPSRRLDNLHQAVGKARKAYQRLPRQTLLELDSAFAQLRALDKLVADYHAEANKTLAELIEHFKTNWAAFEAKFDETMPAELDDDDEELQELFDNVHEAIGETPDEPETFEEVNQGLRSISSAEYHLRQYKQRETTLANWRKGLGSFGEDGDRRAELKALEGCNARQLEMFDKLWEQKLARLDKETLDDEKMLALAVETAEWAGGLRQSKVDDAFPGVDEKIAKSETLTDNVVYLRATGWQIKVGEPGGGTFCARGRKQIVLDPKETRLDRVLADIAHEAGHALFSPPEPPRTHRVANGMEFLTKSLESAFIDEGEAQMNACKVHKEMAEADVAYRVPGKHSVFVAIYDRYLDGELTVEQARIEMGRHFNHLTASGDEGKPYKREYGEPVIDNWNSCCSRAKDKLKYDVLDTLVVFG